MSRSSVTGPALGGIVVFPLYNKRATQAGARDEDGFLTPTAGWVHAASGHSTGTAGCTYTIQKGAVDVSTAAVSNTTGSHFISNEGLGDSTGQAFVGLAMLATSAAIAARQAARGDAITMNCVGVGPAALSLSDHILFAVQGHRYDPDQPSATNYDPPYFSTKD